MQTISNMHLILMISIRKTEQISLPYRQYTLNRSEFTAESKKHLMPLRVNNSLIVPMGLLRKAAAL